MAVNKASKYRADEITHAHNDGVDAMGIKNILFWNGQGGHGTNGGVKEGIDKGKNHCKTIDLIKV